MSHEERDLEQEALERQVSAAFGSLRPRPGFADELWGRVRARRGWRLRARELWDGAGRQALPALGAVAAVVIVVVLVANLAGHHPGGASGGTATGAFAPPRSEGFGALPAPALKAAPGAQDASQPSVLTYVGPATLHWTGVLPQLPTTAPVFRFRVPANADISRGEPRFVIDNGSPGTGDGPADTEAVAAATAFLAAQRLQPDWPYDTVVQRSPGNPTRVYFDRVFAVPGAGPAPEVDQQGTRTGTLVLVAAGDKVIHAEGPLPAAVEPAGYLLRQPEAMTAAAVSASPATSQVAGATLPEVDLTQARLVYMAVIPAGGSSGYYEPALLFTGTFTIGNQLYEKRVLVPAIDPSMLRG